jgi:hypothetical protein
MLSGEATNTNFIVFGLTRPGLKPTIYRTRGEHANHYLTDAVKHVLSLRRGENDISQQTLVTESVNNYEDTPNIGVKIFMRVTQRLLEINRDIFKPIIKFRSPSGYFWALGN